MLTKLLEKGSLDLEGKVKIDTDEGKGKLRKAFNKIGTCNNQPAFCSIRNLYTAVGNFF